MKDRVDPLSRRAFGESRLLVKLPSKAGGGRVMVGAAPQSRTQR